MRIIKCSVDGCGRKSIAHGYCGMHVQRLYRGTSINNLGETLSERFWNFVNIRTGCWEWNGTTAGGYGQFSFFGMKIPAHRMAYELNMGKVLANQQVCHHCDNKLCVRPDHLFLGTASENMRDLVSKGKHPKQLNSYRAKLSPNKVRFIRRSLMSNKALALKFNVHKLTIKNVKTLQTWRGVI